MFIFAEQEVYICVYVFDISQWVKSVPLHDVCYHVTLAGNIQFKGVSFQRDCHIPKCRKIEAEKMPCSCFSGSSVLTVLGQVVRPPAIRESLWEYWWWQTDNTSSHFVCFSEVNIWLELCTAKDLNVKGTTIYLCLQSRCSAVIGC